MIELETAIILGRPQEPASFDAAFFVGKRILVTGAAGSLGEKLCPTLTDLGAEVYPTDITTSEAFPVDYLDVTDQEAVRHMMFGVKPELVYHLAAQKHAPEGEQIPFATTLTNVHGTYNVCATSGLAKIVLASTCKAIQPETAYGATKLIAERMVLNQPICGHVVRLYNVVPASGNVFEIWNGLGGMVPVTDCFRYFISIDEAIAAFLSVPTRQPGRYSPDPGQPRYMPAVAMDLCLDTYRIPPRRGDRLVEPRVGICEYIHVEDGLMRVVSHHDQEQKVREPACP